MRLSGPLRRRFSLANNQTQSQNETVSQTTTGTTVFIEDDSMRIGTKLIPAVAHTGISPVRSEQQIKDFMAKPKVVSNFDWSVSDGAGAVVWSNSIYTMLTAATQWSHKYEGYNLVRGTAVLRVQINAQPFQQGRLLLHFIPFVRHIPAAMTATKNFNLCTKSQQPNIEVDCRDSSCELRIPYISPSYWLDHTAIGYDWGTAYLSVLSPLAVGSGGPTTVDTTVWLHFEDFELAAPVYPQMSNSSIKTTSTRAKRVAPVDKEGSVLAKGGTISEALNKVNDVSTILQEIPLISSIAGTVSWITDIGSRVASIFGYSKPDMEGGIQIIRNDPLAYATNSGGVVPSTNMALSPINKIQITDSFAGTDIDEMSLKYLTQVPAYIGAATWSNTDAHDTLVTSYDLVPTLGVTDVLVKGTALYTLQSYTPMGYLSRYFQFYRGSLKLHMKFVKTDFHSGRLVIAYNPTTVSDAATVAESQLAHRDIVDIRQSSEYVFTMPWMKNISWYRMNQILGTLSIRVLNELRAPETCSSSIKILFFLSAGPDFEMAVPLHSYQFPIVPQMDIGANSATLGVNKAIGTSHIEDVSIDHNALCIGERTSSVKEMIMRSYQIYTDTSDLWAQGFKLYPYAFDIARPTLNSISPTYAGYMDIFSDIASGYSLWRGSVNMQIVNTKTGDGNFACAIMEDTGTSYIDVGASVSAPLNGTISPQRRNVPWFIPNNNYNMINLKIPYYNQTRSTIMRYGSGQLSNISDSYDRPTTKLFGALFGTPTSTTSVVRRSAADDFQFGYFTGFPPVFLNAA